MVSFIYRNDVVFHHYIKVIAVCFQLYIALNRGIHSVPLIQKSGGWLYSHEMYAVKETDPMENDRDAVDRSSNNSIYKQNSKKSM